MCMVGTTYVVSYCLRYTAGVSQPTAVQWHSMVHIGFDKRYVGIVLLQIHTPMLSTRYEGIVDVREKLNLSKWTAQLSLTHAHGEAN